MRIRRSDRCAFGTVLAGMVLAFSVSALFPGAAFAAGEPLVVSLGDSYSSGEGVEPFYDEKGGKGNADTADPDWVAHRSKKSWPGKLEFLVETSTGDIKKVKLSSLKDDTWRFAAASGATTYHLNNEQYVPVKYHLFSKREEAKLPPQLNAIDELRKEKGAASIDYVTMTMGGNDIGFSDIIQSAVANVGWLDFGRLDGQLEDSWQKFETSAKHDLKKAYGDILDHAGDDAQLIVAGYPQLFSEKWLLAYRLGSALLPPLGFKDVLVDYMEAKKINSAATEFNQRINEIIAEMRNDGTANIQFVSVEKAFEGHGAYSPWSYINPIYLLDKKEDVDRAKVFVSSYSMHPNEKGTTAYAKAVQAEIDKLEPLRLGKTGGDSAMEGAKSQGEGARERDVMDSTQVGVLNQWLTGDGEYIYFAEAGVSDGTEPTVDKVARMRADGSEHTVLFEGGEFIHTLKMVDDKLLFSTPNRIVCMNKDGSGAYDVVLGQSLTDFVVHDGRVYYGVTSTDNEWQVQSRKLDGSDLQILCAEYADGTVDVPRLLGVAQSHLVFTVSVSNGGSDYTNLLYTVPIQGGQLYGPKYVGYGNVAVVGERFYVLESGALVAYTPGKSRGKDVCDVGDDDYVQVLNAVGSTVYLGYAQGASIARVDLASGKMTDIGERHLESCAMNIVGDGIYLHYGIEGSIAKCDLDLTYREEWWRISY